MTDKVREQILAIRETGLTNMLDTHMMHGDDKKASTRFEKDYAKVMEWEDGAEDIIRRRKEEIKQLQREGRQCRNGFRMKCIRQELERLEHELETLVDLL